MSEQGPRMLLEFPDDGELLDAVRLAEALERVDEGQPSGIDPIEDPQLAGLVETAALLRSELRVPTEDHAFQSFRTRSRAAVLHALEQDQAPRVTPMRRTRFLAPFAAGAAAASLVLAGAWAAISTPIDIGDEVVAQNMTPRSTADELDRLATVIADIQTRTQSGLPVPALLLREVSEGTARMAQTIEERPEQVTKETVAAYGNATEAGENVLRGVTVEEDAAGALAAAQRASRDGSVVAAQYLSSTDEATATPDATDTVEPASTGTPTETPTATPTGTATETPEGEETATGDETPAGEETTTGSPTPTATPTATGTAEADPTEETDADTDPADEPDSTSTPDPDETPVTDGEDDIVQP